MLKRITYLMAMIVLFSAFIHSQEIPWFDFSNFSVYSIEKQVLQLLNTERKISVVSDLNPESHEDTYWIALILM